MVHSGTKRIDIRYHYLCDLVNFENTLVNYIRSGDMKADMLIKPLPLMGIY